MIGRRTSNATTETKAVEGATSKSDQNGTTSAIRETETEIETETGIEPNKQSRRKTTIRTIYLISLYTFIFTIISLLQTIVFFTSLRFIFFTVVVIHVYRFLFLMLCYCVVHIST